MDKIYCYNKDSHTLHIAGFCDNSTGYNIVEFETEEQVRAKYGLSVGFCRDCLAKREEALCEAVQKEKTKKKGR